MNRSHIKRYSILLMAIISILSCRAISTAGETIADGGIMPLPGELATSPAEIQPTPRLNDPFAPSSGTRRPELIGKQALLLSEHEGRVVFYVTNTDKSMALSSSSYAVILYGAEKQVVNDLGGMLPVLFPGETAAVVCYFSPMDGRMPVSMEVELSDGELIETSMPGIPVRLSNFKFLEDEYASRISGLAINEADQPIQNMQVTMIGLDEQGEIVSADNTYLGYLPPGEHAGYSLQVFKNARVSTLEGFVTINDRSSFDVENPDLRLDIDQWGYRYEKSQLWGGVILSNKQPETVSGSMAYITILGADGTVLDAFQASTGIVPPGGKTAISITSSIRAGIEPAEMRIFTTPGYVDQSMPRQIPLAVQNLTFIDDQYTPRVTGLVLNDSDRKFDNVNVVVLVFDEKDQIIGSGTGYVDFINPNGKAAFEATMVKIDGVKRLEAYPVLYFYPE